MRLFDAEDINSKRFITTFRGYSQDDVREFLNEVSKDYDRLVKIIHILTVSDKRIPQRFKSIEDTLEYIEANDTLA